MERRRAIILLMVAYLLPAFGATYYVDFSGGSDAANGTATSTPWQHCPGDGLATGTAAAASLTAGDTVTFKGGVSYQSSITISKSGSLASLLTFDGNTAGSYGTGSAVMDGGSVNNNNRRYGFLFNLPFSQRSTLTPVVSNICIKGFQFTRFGGLGTYNPANITWACTNKPSAVEGYAIDIAGGRNVYIGSCLFTNIGDWTNAPFMSYSLASGHGVYLHEFVNDVTITNCEFTEIGNAAVQCTTLAPNEWMTNLFFSGNTFHDYIQWGILVNPSASSTNAIVNSIYITNNVMHDMWQYSPVQYLGCSGEFPHTDGIFLWLGYSPTPIYGATLGTVASPLVIANNDFYTNQNPTNNGGTANMYLSGYGGRVLVYNNTFRNVLNQGEGGVFVYGAFDLRTNNCTAIDYAFYNNSFYDQTFGIILQSQNLVGALTNGIVKVENNAFYHTTLTNGAYPLIFGSDQWSTPSVCDYNCYFTWINSQIVATAYPTNATFQMTFSQMQALGFEAHGKYADPLYANISYGLGASSSLNDLMPQSASPLISAGVDLSSVFTKDRNGATRAAPWTIGAYAAQSVTPATQSTLTGSFTLSGSVTLSTQ